MKKKDYFQKLFHAYDDELLLLTHINVAIYQLRLFLKRY